MIAIAPDEGLRLRCPAPSESDFELQLQEIEVVLSASATEELEIGDALFRRSTGASVRYDALVAYLPSAGDAAAPRFTTSNPAVASVDDSGNVTALASGSVDVYCRAFQTTKKVTHNARVQASTTTDAFLNYLEGTLGAHAIEQGDSAVSSGELELFSLKSPQTGQFNRNPACWAASLDWTGVSPHNSLDASRRGGTLISPRHLIWADHFNISNGTSVTFVDNSNQTFTRTVTNSVRIGSTDIRVGVLNADLGASIHYYKVLPSAWREYLTTVLQTFVPLVTTDQEQKALVREMVTATSNSEWLVHQLAQAPDRAPLSENLIVGDSGQPMFMLINGEMVFLGVHYSPGAIATIIPHVTAINAAMTTLGGGYQLTETDLSAFTNFAS